MGQNMSWFPSRRAFSETEKSTESSFRISEAILSSCGSALDSRRVLNLGNDLFVCNLVKEDPYGYSSRIYYRSTVDEGKGVPFQWEAQPGKPKTDPLHHGFNAPPLSPPPSFNSSGEQKMAKNHKWISRKSKKVYGPCLACIPFNVKEV